MIWTQGIFLFLILTSPDHTGTYKMAEYTDMAVCTKVAHQLAKDYRKDSALPKGYSGDFMCGQGLLP